MEDGFKRAKVLYDYDAKDTTELSLMADEVCNSFLFVQNQKSLFFVLLDNIDK